MKRFVVFGAADFMPEEYVPQEGDFLLAADGGYRHVETIGAVPDGILGDFDSLGFVPDKAVVFPVEKDDTDSMLAVRQGLKMGYRDFLLLGCLDGKRLDHTIANIQTLQFLTKQNARGYLVGRDYILTTISGEMLRFSSECQGILSLFCLGPDAKGVYIRGLQYPLEDSVLTHDFPLGVSNHFVGEVGEVTVKEGTLVAVWDRENGYPERIRLEKEKTC